MFAPTNDAFVALLGELGLTKAQLLANTALLTQVLTYHVLPVQVLSSGIPFGQPVATVQGQTLSVGRDLKITDQRGAWPASPRPTWRQRTVSCMRSTR